MSAQEWTILSIKLAFAIVAVVLVAVFLVRPLVRQLRARPDWLELTTAYQLPEEEEEPELQIPAEGVKPPTHAILDHARADPHRTAMLVSRWLRDKK